MIIELITEVYWDTTSSYHDLCLPAKFSNIADIQQLVKSKLVCIIPRGDSRFWAGCRRF